MILGTVVWLFGLYTTTYAYVSTCTELSWEGKAERENLTLYNPGNHFLVINSMKFDCFGDDKNVIDYTNKSFLLAPGESIHLPSDAWMSTCSATFCLACLMYQCNINAQLTPNATVVFLYNDSDLVDFSTVGYTSLSRKKKSSHHTLAVCPSDMISVWRRNDKVLLVIDIPNRKKKKTVYTVAVTCDHSYLLTNLSDNATITNSITHTTPVKRRKEMVVVKIPVITEREVPVNCTLKACLNRRRGRIKCKRKASCTFTIPDDSVSLMKISERRRLMHRTASCSQTKWTWSVLDEQTGNLNLKILNKDWREKTFQVSVRCRELNALNDSVLITIPPMVYARFVTFPLIISMLRNSTNSTRCTIKVCNTAKRRCGRTTKCRINLPVKDGKLITNMNETEEETDLCESVTWSRRRNKRGDISVRLSNVKEENITINVSLSCSELVLARGQPNAVVKVQARSEYVIEFNLKPEMLNTSLVQTDCTVKTCNTEDCQNSEKSCTIQIPVTNGFFSENKRKRQISNLLDYDKRKTITACPSNLVFFNHSSSHSPLLYVNVENPKKKGLPYNVELRCNNIHVLQENGTFSQSATKLIPNIDSDSHEIAKFTFQDNNNMGKVCVVYICLQRSKKCIRQIECEFASFTEPSGCDYLNWTWTPYARRMGDFDVILHRNLLDEITVYNVTLDCYNLKVFNDSVAKLLTPPMAYDEIFSFTVEPMSLRLAATNTKCTFTVCKGDCTKNQTCKVTIPIYNKSFIKPSVVESHQGCTKQIAVWEAILPDKGVLKVKAQNSKEEQTEAMITVHCANVDTISKKLSKTIRVPGKSLRFTKFKFGPKIHPSMINDTNETYCVVEMCMDGDCTTEKKKTCVIRLPINNGNFVVRPKDKEIKIKSHRCHDQQETSSHVPCHDKMWNLVYTPAQLEGEALLVIILKLKPNNQVDLQTNVSLRCEGIIIEDDAQKIIMLSKYEKTRNVSFAIATIRSLELEKHICALNVMYSLLVPSSEGNVTDDDIEELCIKEERCSITIESRVGRIIPKCNLRQMQSLINGTKVDQKMATVTSSFLPSIYGVYTYDAYCTKNNPFTHNSEEAKMKNSFVSESKKTKVVTVHYAPDCDNGTIRKEFENYRKDRCNFLLYGYCQGGELQLENIKDIHFDDDQMYCTPSLVFNRWLQTIQKHTGIHNKPIAALLAIFIVIIALLVTIVIPTIIIIYFCCCRHHHKNDAKRPSVGIVISSCDEWEEANAMLKTMTKENNSKIMMGRSNQKMLDAFSSSAPDDSDFETPVYRLSKKVDNYNQQGPDIQENSAHSLGSVIQQLVEIDESTSEEHYGKLSATCTELSSTLDGWGGEYTDDNELHESF